MTVILEKKAESLFHLTGKVTCQKAFRELICQRKILLLPALPYPQVPQAILDNIGIVDIRPHEPGVVRFHDIIQIRPLILYYLSCQQHTAGLPANHACPDHTVSDKEIIHWTEVFTDHFAHLLIPRHHDSAHTRTGFRYVCSHLIFLLVQVEKTVPEIRILLIPRPLVAVHDLIKTACADAV